MNANSMTPHAFITHLTEDERRDLSDKVRDANRRSSNGSGR
ncbi:hypothetical protein [Streptomyces noursei]|nr:hypothetical protein [Streptomyces noursei]